MNRTALRCLTVGLVFLFGAMILGCGAVGKVRQAAAKAKRTNELKEVALAYMNYCDDHQGKPPSKADDLLPLLASADTAQDLRGGEIVVLWGADVAKIQKAQGLSKTVLAYEKGVPTSGGLVVMADGSATQMTAQEFQAAPKAAKAAK